MLTELHNQANARAAVLVRSRKDGADRYLLIPTTRTAVSCFWLLNPAALSPTEYRTVAHARAGALPVYGNSQPHRINGAVNPARLCPCQLRPDTEPRVETVAHLLSACPRWINIFRLRHDEAVDLVCAATTPELQKWPLRYELRREVHLAQLGEEQADGKLLRPDVLLIDHQDHTDTSFEFTFADDAGLTDAERRKHYKYDS